MLALACGGRKGRCSQTGQMHVPVSRQTLAARCPNGETAPRELLEVISQMMIASFESRLLARKLAALRS